MSDDRERRGDEGSRDGNRGHGQAPNVKPKHDPRDRTSKKDQVNKDKSGRVRRSRSTDSERVGRVRRRERERGAGERRLRGRSEEARRRDRKEGEKPKPPADDVEDTECVVCFCSYDNVFKTPKLLACGHTFCLECLARINVSSPELKSLSCPVCRETTELPHGRDLPHLGNNQDIFRKLPPGMQRALSIRFKRSKGKLVVKNPAPGSPTKPSTFALPKAKQGNQPAASGELHLGALEQGLAPATTLDVGRPPSMVRGRLRRLCRSDRCYYAVVGSIITITVALMLVGILAFVIMPNVVAGSRPPNNFTLPNQPGNTPPGVRP
ncbi:E3 ubiquitin-protein ligase RNF183 [Polymixia lowei]